MKAVAETADGMDTKRDAPRNLNGYETKNKTA
jgi:hypothetical protein